MEFNADKKFKIQTEPIFSSYNNSNLIYLINVLLRMCKKSVGYKNKVLLSIIIFDVVFKNFNFILDNKQIALVVKNKLYQFNSDIDKINKIDEVCGDV